MMTQAQFENGVAYAEKNLNNDLNSHLHLDKKFFREHLDLNNKKILDFGCGMAGMSIWIAKQYKNCEVYGLDIDAHHIEIAEYMVRKHNVSNVKVELRDVLEIPLQDHEKFDLIIFNDVVEHVPMEILDQIFKQVSSHLMDNGQIYLGYPPWEGPYASHATRATRLYWCQFLPDPIVINLISKYNEDIVGVNEPDLVSAYKGLNKLTHKKLGKVIAQNQLKIHIRKSHSIINKIGIFKNINVRIFPFNYLITKEILLLEPE